MKYENFSKAKEIVEKIDRFKNLRTKLISEVSVRLNDFSGRYIIELSETEENTLTQLTKNYLNNVRLYYQTEIDALHKELEEL